MKFLSKLILCCIVFYLPFTSAYSSTQNEIYIDIINHTRGSIIAYLPWDTREIYSFSSYTYKDMEYSGDVNLTLTDSFGVDPFFDGIICHKSTVVIEEVPSSNIPDVTVTCLEKSKNSRVITKKALLQK